MGRKNTIQILPPEAGTFCYSDKNDLIMNLMKSTNDTHGLN